jgi:hypothetical protein
VEFQDEFNEYQQDSLSLVDVDDALLTDRQVTSSYLGAGIAEFRSGDADAAIAAQQDDRRIHIHRVQTTVKGHRDRAGRSDHGHVFKGRAGTAAVPRGEARAGAGLSDGAE